MEDGVETNRVMLSLFGWKMSTTLRIKVDRSGLPVDGWLKVVEEPLVEVELEVGAGVRVEVEGRGTLHSKDA